MYSSNELNKKIKDSDIKSLFSIESLYKHGIRPEQNFLYPGKRVCGDVRDKRKYNENNVYVANYYRAILDMIFEGLMKYEKIMHLNCVTYDYLDNNEQVSLVVEKARLLKPFLNENQFVELERWIYNETHYEEIRSRSKN